MSFPRIASVRALVARGGGADYHDQGGGHWIDGQIATPMSIYPEYRDTRSSFGLTVLGTVIVGVEAEDGTIGVGTSTGGPPAAWLVEHHFSRFVEGKRPDELELMWDQMWRASMFYGRKGLAVNAVSAVDLAGWGLLGRLRQGALHASFRGPPRVRISLSTTPRRPGPA